MREILFRGKDIAGHWIYGGFHLWKTRQPCVLGDELKPDEIKHIIIKNSFADWNMPRTMRPYEVIPKTVGQYTGLTDKNGKKIFEGDILKGMGGLHRVYFDISLACFEWAKINGNWEESFSGFADEYEIIGNIHDNPELLKEREGK